jgi:hypothetical protein
LVPLELRSEGSKLNRHSRGEGGAALLALCTP